jgi:hypothetical protein
METEQTLKSLLTVVVLYSKKDELYRNDLAPYLNQLQEQQVFSEIRYIEAESFDSRRFTDLLPRIDICVCLLSIDFLDAMSRFSSIQQKIMDEHRVKRLRVAVYLLHDWPTEHTYFRSGIILPDDDKPILSGEWKYLHDAMEAANHKLIPVCEAYRDYKEEVDFEWEMVKDSGSEVLYWQFLRQYPHCAHARLAQNQLNDLIEQRLWQKAKKSGMAQDYYHYLQSAPLRNYQLEAASALATIEESEAKIWEDISKFESAPLYYRYKLQFPKGKQNPTVDKKLEVLTQKQAIKLGEEVVPEEYNALFLWRKTYDALKDKPADLYAVNTYVQYCNILRRKAFKLNRNLATKPYSFGLYVILFLLTEFALYTLFKSPEPLDMRLISNIIKGLIAVLFNLFIIYKVYRSIELLQEDQTFAQNAMELMRRASVLLRASYITGDQQSVQEILGVMSTVEEKVGLINKKGFLNYLVEPRGGRGGCF